MADSTITIFNAWAIAPPNPNNRGAIYFSILNSGAKVDQVTGFNSPIIQNEEASFMLPYNDNDLIEWHPFAMFQIPPGEPVVFKPGGFYLALAYNKTLKTGDTFPLTLNFEVAGTIQVKVTVQDVEAILDE